MTVDIAKFRTDFTEFASTVTYPDPSVQFYLDLAQGDPTTGLVGFIGPRYASKADFATELWTAHNLSMEFESKRNAARGMNPGQIIAPLSGGTVDKVSYVRNLTGILDPNAGHWNLSVYGIRFLWLMKMAGAGPVQVSPGCSNGAIYPWAGPFFPPSYP